MKNDFKSRFMPNIKFKFKGDITKISDIIDAKMLSNGLLYAITNSKGNAIFHIPDICFDFCILKEVSIYEAIPELIPDGIRYNKELDKLVPDVISASDEYCSGIKVEFEKVVDYTEEKIKKRENGFIKADLDKIDFTLVEPYAYQDLAKQLTLGVKKYSRDNWKKGDILSYLAALERHINHVKIALEENDLQKLIDDTGVNQGGALMFNSMAIHYFIRKELEKC